MNRNESQDYDSSWFKLQNEGTPYAEPVMDTNWKLNSGNETPSNWTTDGLTGFYATKNEKKKELQDVKLVDFEEKVVKYDIAKFDKNAYLKLWAPD